jgi:hypothetical protein
MERRGREHQTVLGKASGTFVIEWERQQTPNRCGKSIMKAILSSSAPGIQGLSLLLIAWG